MRGLGRSLARVAGFLTSLGSGAGGPGGCFRESGASYGCSRLYVASVPCCPWSLSCSVPLSHSSSPHLHPWPGLSVSALPGGFLFPHPPGLETPGSCRALAQERGVWHRARRLPCLLNHSWLFQTPTGGCRTGPSGWLCGRFCNGLHLLGKLALLSPQRQMVGGSLAWVTPPATPSTTLMGKGLSSPPSSLVVDSWLPNFLAV